MTEKPERKLDRVLRGNPAADPETAALAETAGRLEHELDADVPDAERQRALFVAGVRGAKRPFPLLRVVVPAMGVVGLFLLALLSRGAVPGDALYPMREALHSVGLAPSPLREINDRIDTADELLDAAERTTSDANAEEAALDAIHELGEARDLLSELNANVRNERTAEIALLEARAIAVIQGLDEETSGDNSGPGSGDDADDDTSGPGGGDTDNSGPGSGDDGDTDGDNSGPGSGDGDTDDSGPGSGVDEDTDNSGPGSDGSASSREGSDSGSG